MENKERKLYQRSSGWLVEYPSFNKEFLKYLFVRSFAFVLDFALFLAMQWVFQQILGFSWLVSASISYFLFLGYNLLFLLLFKGSTLGLKAGKLTIINKSTTVFFYTKMMIRASITALFALSFIGYAFMIANAITIAITRGMGITDLLSKTQVVSKHYANYLKRIEKKYDIEK